MIVKRKPRDFDASEKPKSYTDKPSRTQEPALFHPSHSSRNARRLVLYTRLQYLWVTSHAQCPPSTHAVESGGILGGAPPSLLRTQRAALMRVRTSLKSSRAGSETSSARASCARGATVRATARGRPVRLALAQALA